MRGDYSAMPRLEFGEGEGNAVTDTDHERFAGLVADHVVSAIERVIGERLEPEERRHRVTGALMREMLAAMPTTSGQVLAHACNRYLSGRPDQGFVLPLVADVDMGDGSVVMRAV